MPADPEWKKANPELPDARPQRVRGEKRHPVLGWMEPIYCVNCGKPGGLVTKEWAKLAYYICDDCDEKLRVGPPLMEIPESLVRGND